MSRDITCPFCATRLVVGDEATGRISCPRCLAVIEWPGGAADRPGRRSADREVHGDAGTTHVVLLVLTGLCVVGILLAYVSARSGSEGLAIFGMLVIAGLFAVLEVLVFVQLGLRIWTRPLGPSPDAAARFGKVLGVVALTIGLALAVVVFFFGACAVLLNTM
jgi:hypothetical protein